MKSVLYGGLALVLALGFSGIASAQSVPSSGADAAKADAPPAAGAPAPAAAGTDPRMQKAAEPIKAILAQIEKAQKLLSDESAKPAEKQDAKKIRSMKEAIARLYLTASQKAKFQSASFKGDDKQAFLDQYEKPNREKAISLLLELANEALSKKDFRGAEALAKQILALDPKNAEAEALVKKIAEDKVAAAKAGTTSGSGSDLKDKNLDPNLQDFSRTGRGAKPDYSKSDGKGGTRSW